MSFNLTITDKPTHVVVWHSDQKDSVSELVKTLSDRVASLEQTVSKFLNNTLSGIEMRREDNFGSLTVVHDDSNELFKTLIEAPHADGTDAEVEVEVEVEEEEEAEVEVEEEEDADGTEVEEEEEDAEAEEEEEEEAEALELDEFEYKGITYFKDTENQVYQVGLDGDLDDTPIGVWNEEKQKVLKYAKA
jgi:hypothetical protein